MNLNFKVFNSTNFSNSLPILEKIYKEEKNQSILNLVKDINYNNFKGWITFIFQNNDVISCAALEDSFKYTNENNSLRFCRYYKLKPNRKITYNVYQHLNEHVKIAKRENYKIIYFTVFDPRVYKDLNRSRGISIYDKYKTIVSIDDFKIRDDIVFKINDNCVQRIFEYKLDNKYNWNPTSKFIVSSRQYNDQDILNMYNKSKIEGKV
jgi:hypothetical protein